MNVGIPLRLYGCLAVALLVIGCVPKASPPPGYFGITQPMCEVVAAINSNNSAITSLWARHDYEATIIDAAEKKSHFVNGDGILLYHGPAAMRIVGTKDIAGTVFEIGSTVDRYWLKIIPEMDTMWWGEYRNLAARRPSQIPIRPNLVIQVLGIGPIAADFLQEPIPVMRFNNDADAYMFVWSTRIGDRWVAQKEIWYDRQSKLPTLVLLFDENGRVVLRAYLSKHQPLEIPGRPASQWPQVATEYKLFFPDSTTSMSFTLRDVALQHNGVPNQNSIRFPREPGVARIINVDAEH